MTEQAEQFAKTVATAVAVAERQIKGIETILKAEVERTRNEADPIDMAMCYVRTREAKETLEGALTILGSSFTSLATRHYPELLEQRGMPNVSLIEVGRVIGVQYRTKASVKDGKKQDAINFLLGYKEESDSGETIRPLEGLVVPHIFPQTLSSTAKTWAKEGKELPEELFTTFLQPNTTWRKIAS